MFGALRNKHFKKPSARSPGINIIEYGGNGGQAASLFLRGGFASDALVLVDGIEVKDPSTPDRSIDFFLY